MYRVNGPRKKNVLKVFVQFARDINKGQRCSEGCANGLEIVQICP